MEILNELEKTVTRNALRFHVSHAIFCPACQSVMDVRRAVEVDFRKGDQLVHSAIRCAACYDRNQEYFNKVAGERGLTVEVTDGRILYKAEPAKSGSHGPSNSASRRPRNLSLVDGT